MIFDKALLEEVCEISMGQAPTGDTYNSHGEGLPLIAGAGDFGDRSPEATKFTTSPTKVSRPGDIILCIRATIGDRNWADGAYCLGRGVAGLLGNARKLDQGYLWHWLGYVTPELRAKGRGATFLQVNKADIGSLRIPLPPLAEQGRIAALLDKADTLRGKRYEAIAKFDQLLQSVFLDMFGDPVSNDKAWPQNLCLGDVAEIVSGITKGRRTSEPVRSIPYLAVANVQERRLKLDAVRSIEATAPEIRKYRLVKNDLLLTEGGDPDKLGRGALWDGSIKDCIHQNHVFRVRVTSEAIDPVYLSWLVGSARGKRYFLGAAKQTTGIASINMSQLRRFPLLVPPAKLQDRFARLVLRIELEKKRLVTASTLTERMFASLQQRAFVGLL